MDADSVTEVQGSPSTSWSKPISTGASTRPPQVHAEATAHTKSRPYPASVARRGTQITHLKSRTATASKAWSRRSTRPASSLVPCCQHSRFPRKTTGLRSRMTISSPLGMPWDKRTVIQTSTPFWTL